MDQKQVEGLAESLRAQGLTWVQADFVVSLVRNGLAAERARCAAVVRATKKHTFSDCEGSLEKAARAIEAA